MGPDWTKSEVRIADLHLDVENPRLPEAWSGKTEDELNTLIEASYDPISIARSIAEYGYFSSEPMIVMPRDGGGFTVLEGNRRLVALRGLSDDALRATFESPEEWAEIAGSGRVPERVPIVVVDSWDRAAPIIGYRHISGIQQWDPYAKARFIARLIDGHGYSFQDTAQLVGEEVGDVKAAYRNFHIAKQAREKMDIDTSYVEKGFGVFARAMTSPGIREHIGAPQPRSVQVGQDPLPPERRGEVQEVFSWVFGDDSEDAVIDDSRDLDRLGRAITTEDGLSTLRETRSLQRAIEASRGRRERLISRLTSARNSLRSAAEEIPRFRSDEDVRALLREIADLLASLIEENDGS